MMKVVALRRRPAGGCLSVREDAVLPALTDLIAARVFGPDRQAHLRDQHHAAPREKAEAHARAIDTARQAIHDITTRQDNLMAELETTDPTTDAAYRASIRKRFNDLDTERVKAEAHLADLIATQPVINEGMPALLDAMPTAQRHLSSLPAPMHRRLFEALNLNIRLDNPRRAHVTITLTTDTPGETARVVADTAPDADDDPGTTQHLPSAGTVSNPKLLRC